MCGSCWTFATLSAFETAVAIQNGIDVPKFSE